MSTISKEEMIFTLFRDFLDDGFELLKVGVEQRAKCVPGMTFVDGKIDPVAVYWDKREVVFCSMVFNIINAGKDAPTPLRILAYQLVSQWKRSIVAGEWVDGSYEDYVSALAMAVVKGLQIADSPLYQANAVEIRRKIVELTKFDTNVKWAISKPKGVTLPFIIVKSDSSFEKYMKEVTELTFENSVVHKPLERIGRKELGSRENPFMNVNDAVDYVLDLERKRLNGDTFRQFINEMPYFLDSCSMTFRIPWASPFVSYVDGPEVIENGFVVNQLQSGRFNFKPSLVNRKFLFRGQSEFYNPCVPNIFRKKDEDYFLRYHIYTCEMQILLKSHPMVRMFGDGIELFNDRFVFEVNYNGLSQHYYNKTQMLDLTSDFEAAKFFAVTKFDFDNNRYVPYEGDELGVLYYYDIEPDAFSRRSENNKVQLSAIGKQPFMRSGAQHGFLLSMVRGEDFNLLPQTGYVFFRHDSNITHDIYERSNNGKLYQDEDILQSFWYEKLKNPISAKTVSMAAVELNRRYNPRSSKTRLLKELRKEGFTVLRDYIPSFTLEQLNQFYYNSIEEYWADFCHDVYFASPEGRILKNHLEALPQHPIFGPRYFSK